MMTTFVLVSLASDKLTICKISVRALWKIPL